MFWYHRLRPYTDHTRYEYKLAIIYRKLIRSFQSSKRSVHFRFPKKPFSNPILEVQPNLDQKREEKEENNCGSDSKKTKQKQNSLCASFSSAQSFFWSIRNTLFREKHTISTLVFMQDFFDEQITWLLRAKSPPPPPFLQYFQNPLAVLRISEKNGCDYPKILTISVVLS